MRVNRQTLLQQLEAVSPGLATREVVEQSSCYVFLGGKVLTYNDEIACSLKCDLAIEGAVPAAPLTTLLSKLPEEEIEITLGTGELEIKGKNRKAGIRMERDILLPVEGIERPAKGTWKDLPDDFLKALGVVQQCAGTDEANFCLTCVHIHPKYLEACDNFQMSRYNIATPVEKSTLVKHGSLRHIIGMEMSQISETETWMHFRNSTGLVLSCRRWNETFPELGAIMDFKGSPITLPGGLAEAIDKAEVFSGENAENNNVLIQLRAGRLKIGGKGVSGWYQEMKQVKYDGPDISFIIAPKLLMEITKRHNECQVTAEKLKVDGGAFTYVSCLGASDET